MSGTFGWPSFPGDRSAAGSYGRRSGGAMTDAAGSTRNSLIMGAGPDRAPIDRENQDFEIREAVLQHAARRLELRRLRCHQRRCRTAAGRTQRLSSEFRTILRQFSYHSKVSLGLAARRFYRRGIRELTDPPAVQAPRIMPGCGHLPYRHVRRLLDT
jgi:hypothetical protein